jgi:hypothetical protein
VDQGCNQPYFSKGLAHLQGDKSGPHQYSSFAPSFCNEIFYANGICQIPQVENAIKILTINFERARLGTGGKNKMVEGELLATFEFHRPILGLYSGNPGMETHGYA